VIKMGEELYLGMDIGMLFVDLMGKLGLNTSLSIIVQNYGKEQVLDELQKIN
jgi:hypothetical protein